jgi:hypothetical protein
MVADLGRLSVWSERRQGAMSARRWAAALCLVALAPTGCGANRRAHVSRRAARSNSHVQGSLAQNRANAASLVLGRMAYVPSSPTRARRQARSRSRPRSPQPNGKTAPRARYEVRLIGGHALSPPGAPGAGGTAAIAIYGSSEICWRFSGIHGLHRPTGATIQAGRIERAVVVFLGAGFQARGCYAHVPPLTIRRVMLDPSNYGLAVTTRTYPLGAIAGRL